MTYTLTSLSNRNSFTKESSTLEKKTLKKNKSLYFDNTSQPTLNISINFGMTSFNFSYLKFRFIFNLLLWFPLII